MASVDKQLRPVAILLAGPRGRSKSLLVEELATNLDYQIVQTSDANALIATRRMLDDLESLVSSRRSFLLDSTLGGPRVPQLASAWRRRGYFVALKYLAMGSEGAAIEAIRHDQATKHRDAGSDDLIRARYRTGLRTLFADGLASCDSWEIYDASDESRPRLVVSGPRLSIRDRELLSNLQENVATSGVARMILPTESLGLWLPASVDAARDLGLKLIAPQGERILEAILADEDGLFALTPSQFELLVAELLNRSGWDAKVSAAGADKGIDVVANRLDMSGSFLLVAQCKFTRSARNVAAPVVRDMYGVVHLNSATMGLVVTTGGYTKPARDVAARDPSRLGLRDVSDVKAWVRSAGRS